MISKMYCTAENSIRSFARRSRFLQTRGARAPLAALAIAVGFGVFVITIGEGFQLLVATTDSAAPAGVYQVASGEVRRGDLVAACLPPHIAQMGRARGYLR